MKEEMSVTIVCIYLLMYELGIDPYEIIEIGNEKT